MSSSRSRNSNEGRIYVGNLPRDIRVRDLQDLFDPYGKIVYIDLKTKYSVPFAFIDYEDPSDARYAVRKRNNYEMDGYPLIVEQPRGKSYQDRDRGRDRYGSYSSYGGSGRSFGGSSRGFGGRRYDDDRRGGRGGYRGRYDDDDGGSPKPRFNIGYHVRITGLPTSTSWQDLKDLMREAGEVGYTDIKRGTGVAIVQFHRHDDMKYAIKKFDDYDFVSSKGDKAVIRVREEETGKSPLPRGSARSVSRSRSRSPIRGRGRDSRSSSRSVSPMNRGGNGSPSPRRSMSPAGSRSRSMTPIDD